MPILCLDEIFQGRISGLPSWEPRSRAGIYLVKSLFPAVSIALVLNPATGNISPQFHVAFYDEFSTVSFMMEGTIPPNWTDLLKFNSKSGVPENVDLKGT